MKNYLRYVKSEGVWYNLQTHTMFANWRWWLVLPWCISYGILSGSCSIAERLCDRLRVLVDTVHNAVLGWAQDERAAQWVAARRERQRKRDAQISALMKRIGGY